MAVITARIPTQIVDGNFHNYRVRCRKADNTPSCVETESAAMSLKITTAGPAPAVSISPTEQLRYPNGLLGQFQLRGLDHHLVQRRDKPSTADLANDYPEYHHFVLRPLPKRNRLFE